MRAAVEGSWSFTIMPQGGSGPIQVTVKVVQADTAPAAQARAESRALVRAAYACGSRTLVRSVGACMDSSVMPLAVTYVSGDASFASAPLSGTFEVLGTTFQISNSFLRLSLGDFDIEAQLGPDGAILNAHVAPGGAPGNLTIVARA
jgi:hypothetical protein